MKQIYWEIVLPVIDQVSIIRVYLSVVSSCTDDYKWYSNQESRSRIGWRWQMAPSTVKYAISQLVKKGFLRSESRGIYSVDKKYLKNEELVETS